MKYIKYITEKNDKSDREITEEAKRDIDDYLLILKDEGYRVETKAIMDYHGILHVKLSTVDKNLSVINQLNNTDPFVSKIDIKWGDVKYDILSAISSVGDRFKPICVYYKDIKNRSTGSKRWLNFLAYIQDDQVLSSFTVELDQIVDRN